MPTGRQLNRKQSSRVDKANRSDYGLATAKKLEHLLFLLPQNAPSAEPVMDDITMLVMNSWAANKKSRYAFKGTHRCSCGVGSTNTDHFIGPNYDIVTNSLCLHYVQFHRDEVPQAELDRILTLLTPA